MSYLSDFGSREALGKTLLQYLNRDSTIRELDKTINYSDLHRIFAQTIANSYKESGVSLAEEINNPAVRDMFLSDLSIKLTKEGDIKAAKEVATIIDNKFSQSAAYQAICFKYLDTNEIEKAINEAGNIRDEMCHGHTLERIAMKLFKSGKIQEAMDFAKKIPGSYSFSARWCIWEEAKNARPPIHHPALYA